MLSYLVCIISFTNVQVPWRKEIQNVVLLFKHSVPDLSILSYSAHRVNERAVLNKGS
jgi:hypothetical protein